MSCGPAFVGLPSICIQVKRVKRDLKTGEDEFDDCRLRVLRVVQATTPSPTAKFASANRLVSFYNDNFACMFEPA